MNKLTQMINRQLRRRTPDFSHLMSNLTIGGYFKIAVSSLDRTHDIRALPLAMCSKIGNTEIIPDTMSYLIIRAESITLAGQPTFIQDINNKIPIEKIYDFDDGTHCYCILLSSNDSIMEYNLTSECKIFRVISITKDDVVCRYELMSSPLSPSVLNINGSREKTNNILDDYAFMLYKKIVPDTISIESSLDEEGIHVSGDVEFGIYNPMIKSFIKTITYAASNDISGTVDDITQSFIEASIVYRGVTYASIHPDHNTSMIAAVKTTLDLLKGE